MVEAGLAEAHRLARVELGRDDDQARGELAEVVGPALDAVDLLQVVADRLVVEEPHRQRARQPQSAIRASVMSHGPAQAVAERLGEQRRRHQRAPQQLADRGREEGLGDERVLARLLT